MQHIIKKQIFNLLLGSEQDAFYLQHRVSTYNQKEIIQVLQKVFDEISTADETIVIDKLEIDLGNLSEKEIRNDQWSGLFEIALRKQLAQIATTEITSGLLIKKPEANNTFHQWLHAMKNGYLPWNAKQTGKDWYDKVLEAIATDYKIAEEFRIVLRNDTSVVERIILQHSISFLISVIELLTAEKQERLFGIVDEFYIVIEFLQRKSKHEVILNKRSIGITIWKEIFKLASFNVPATTVATTLTTETIIERLTGTFFSSAQIKQAIKLKTISSKLHVALNALKKCAFEKDTEKNKADLFIKEISLEKKEGKIFKETESSIKPVTISKNLKKESTEKLFKEDEQGIINPTRDTKKKSTLDIIEKDEIFVKHAGIVLLHPFLHSFFKITEYVNEGKFINKEFHHKALYLIHFLATGNTEAHEYDLTIAKILCGYPLEDAVNIVVELREKELQEAEDLLVVAISRWEILKNTSAKGLREGFLQRPGKLQVKNDELILQVETSSIDMLLDHLPWNLSIIKLPWMENILKVQWR